MNTNILRALIPPDGRFLTKGEIDDVGVLSKYYKKKYMVKRKSDNNARVGILCVRTKLNTYIPMEGIPELTMKGFVTCK